MKLMTEKCHWLSFYLFKKIDLGGTGLIENIVAKCKEKVTDNKVISVFLVLPYIIIGIIFLVLPMISLIIHSFDSGIDGWLKVFANNSYLRSIKGSFKLALWTTIESSIIGGLLAVFWAPRLKKHSWFIAFVNFGSNNGGVGLAFLLIACLGTNGMITLILKEIGIDLYPGFQYVSLTGLHWAYLSFLIPFMCLIFMPSVGCIKPEWYNAAKALGASKYKYIIRIAWPVIFPSFLASASLVFLQAMGTYATAYAIAENKVDLITLKIGYLSEVAVFNKADANILSVLLLLIMICVVCLYSSINKRANRWLR